MSPLLRQLLIEAADLPIDYAADSRAGTIMALVVEEVRRAPVLPMCVPLPRHRRLNEACRSVAAAPSIADTTGDWARRLAMSRRSFTRLFRRETGLSFADWQRRCCLQAALPRLLAGEPVTTIALDLGYSGPAAFTAMFSRLVGSPPRNFARQAKHLLVAVATQ